MVTLINEGDYVLDIGAYVGSYTRVLSKAVGPAGLVHRFEPIPSTFGLLRFCVRRLQLRNASLFNCAASRVNGRAVMTVPHYPTLVVLGMAVLLGGLLLGLSLAVIAVLAVWRALVVLLRA